MASDPPSNSLGSAVNGSPRLRGSTSTPGTTHPGHAHRPSQPSSLRHAHMPPESPEDRARAHPDFVQRGIVPGSRDDAPTDPDVEATHQRGTIEEPPDTPDIRTRLLNQFENTSSREESYGTFHERGRLHRNYDSFTGSDGDSILTSPTYGGPYPEGQEIDGEAGSYNRNPLTDVLGDSVTDGLLGRPKKTGTTHWLAERAGIKRERLMYVYYYIPIFNWIRQYRWSFLKGDLIGALTMASFYIPTALSYASNLGHMPPINGLYAFVFNPLIYALLGTCPQMVVGPEAAGSLLTGSVVTEAIKKGHIADTDGVKAAQVGGMVTGLAGGIILVAGICRFGFLDSVLSRPFLRGFISSIGLVILINQLVPEMGLDKQAAHSVRASHGSPLEQIMFLFDHGHEAHKLTCAVSFGTLAIVLVLRELKRRLQPLPKLGWVVYVPDRFAVVVLSAVFAWQGKWDERGVDIMGDIKSGGGQPTFQPHFPFAQDNFKHVNDAFQTAFIVALLGFFESCVAAKSLGLGTGKTKRVTKKRKDGTTEEVEESQGIRNMTVSANRELVALGVANVVGGVFMALPAFGGYGRSKVNKSTGGKTPMSSIFLSLITVLCILFLLPYFYYIPKGVLSAMITVVSISLLEEAPHDIIFFWRVRGYVELFLMTLIFLTTFFWSLRGGILVGLTFSLIRLLRHSARPRIQILGRTPGTNEFENVEFLAQDGSVEMVPHCLIVKIPEPLTFANTGSLKDRLKRLEDHGTSYAHPALPTVRSPEHNKNVIFDIHGVTGMDTAAAQVLLEIIQDYHDRGTRVLFCRIPSRRSEVWQLMNRSGIVELVGGERSFHSSVPEALRATEKTSTFHEYIEQEGEFTDRTDHAFSQDEGGPGRESGLRQREPSGQEERMVG